MGPPKSGRSISQQAFDEMVKENMEDLGMDPTEALQDAIQTLTLQGVDLSGIITCVPGESNPVMECLDKLKQLNGNWSDLNHAVDEKAVNEIVELLEELYDMCEDKGSGNAAIATKNGGIELLISICTKLRNGFDRGLVSSLKTIASLLHDLQCTEIFRESGGPKIVVGILYDGRQDISILDSGFSVVAAASTGNEVLKESFMELKIDELIVQILKEHDGGSIPSVYDAICILLTSDDNRVVASQVFGYARKFAKLGIAEVLVDSLREGISSPSLVSASIALKAVAVNDEICRSVAYNGGIDAILHCIDNSGLQGNNTVARACCSLLSKLAGSDENKSAIVEKQGMDTLIKLSSRFSDDPSVLQEVMYLISILCLRSPENAARAIESGAGDLAIQVMQTFPDLDQLQRNSCLMIRNLVVRNPENRTLLLGNGIEALLRKAKGNHRELQKCCH
ncbi:ARM repeat superfamily protein [Abeliophyllum distichum]|uniref:ARM repeat superfamily protein n=1 Tax=Abeliophyllum distichum TaxID=126358 RepID=A0ABD1P8L2_9LAMI